MPAVQTKMLAAWIASTRYSHCTRRTCWFSKTCRSVALVVRIAFESLTVDAAELADQRGMLVRTYSRAQVIEYFEELGAMTKHRIAETIAKHIPALNLYVPPARKPWMSEDARMGIFDAAALAWMFFQSIDRDRQAA